MAFNMQAYSEAMNAPLRPPTIIELRFTNSDMASNAPYKHEATVNFKMKTSDIVKLDEKWEIDPLSMKLPHHTLNFDALDFSGRYAEMYNWNKRDCRVKLTYIQYRLDGKTQVVRESIFYVHEVSNRNHITSFKCEDIMPILTSNIYSKGPSGKILTTVGELLLDIKTSLFDPKYPSFSNIDVMFNGLDENKQVIYECKGEKISNLLQMLANSQSKTMYIVHSNFDVDNTTNQWRVIFNDSNVDKAPGSEIGLNISSVMKDGLEHDVSESIGKVGIKYHDPRFKSGAYSVTETPIKIRNDIGSDNWQRVDFDGLYKDVYIDLKNPSAPNVDNIRNLSLSGCEIHWTLNAVKDPTVTLMGNPVGMSEMEITFTKSDSGGKSITLDNPFIDLGLAGVNGLPTYVGYRHNLRMKYRGEPFLTPMARIWFTHAPNKKSPCMVLSNTINYNGTLSGEIVLKAMVKDITNPIVAGEVKTYRNTRLTPDGVVHQVKADTYTNPRVCAYLYASNTLVSNNFEVPDVGLKLGRREVVLDIPKNHEKITEVIYGVYGKPSATYVMRYLTVSPGVKKLGVSLDLLTNEQGSITWDNDMIYEVK